MAAIPPGSLASFYFRRSGGRVLLTNEWGRWAWLSEEEFTRLLEGSLRKDEPLHRELSAEGFLQDEAPREDLARSYAARNSYLLRGPSLHIAVLSGRCNYGCLYCQASAKRGSDASLDMTPATARRVVDFIFQCPSKEFTLEFQGGEPLLNWKVLKLMTLLARRRAETEGRTVRIALVSNFSLLDDRRLAFLMRHKVALCTSLDGPPEVHDKNRPWSGGSSHAEVVRWLKVIAERYPDTATDRHCRPNALLTVTRRALARPEAVVDEYVRLGLASMFIRSLTPIGAARKSWKAIGYTPEEFLAFYRRCFERILEVNRSGRRFRERGAAMLLLKILRGEDPGFVDIRSPCGAGLGQLAYHYDGAVYTCDEGRMMAEDGDPLFRLGDVRTTSYREALLHPTVKACAVSSLLEAQPSCSGCAFKPFCGVCPVYNYAAQRTIWGRMPENGRCAVMMGVFDLLFEKLGDPAARPILESWTVVEGPEPAE